MEQAAIGILQPHRLMTIATVRRDGWPQAAIVGYANEGWSLYFLIYRDSQKFANITRDNRVAVTVGSEPPGNQSDPGRVCRPRGRRAY